MRDAIDLRGYLCPVPLLIAKQALQQCQIGDELHFTLNLQASIEDFQLLAEHLNCQQCEAEQQPTQIMLRITR